MNKFFLKLSSDNDGYEIFQTKNFELSDLFLFLQAWGDSDSNRIKTSNGLNWEWLSLRKMSGEKYVYLWDRDSVKDPAVISNLSPAEQHAFDNAYEVYLEKRWDDMSKLIMTIENYIEIVYKWQRIALGIQLKYIILSQDAAGYVDLIGKDELSEQDRQDMEIEHEKYLKYKEACEAYDKDHPDHSDLWRGPQDNEFEEDVMKYYKD